MFLTFFILYLHLNLNIMKKILFSAFVLSGLFLNAQAFTDSFETGDGWLIISNGSTDPNEQWGLWSAYGTAITPRTGSSMAGIQYSADVAHDDYLISPQFTVTSGTSDKLSVYAINRSTTFPETLSILVSETGTTAASFTATVTASLTPATTWTKYSYDLTPFVGKQIYVAFHSTTFDKWFVGLDDFEISGNTLAVDNVSKSEVKISPNPFKDVLTISDVKDVKSIAVYDASGREVLTPKVATELNLSSLSKGAYFVTVTYENGTKKSLKAIKN